MIAALLVLAAFVGVWQLYVELSGVEEIVLPGPSAVAAALVEERDALWPALVTTGTEIVLGLALALALGIAVAVAMHLVPRLRALYPLLVTTQAIPVVVVAPVLVFWLGFSLVPKLILIAVVCFFPIVVTTLDALGRVDPDQRKLLRTLDASRWQAFRWAEAPAALPAALSGAKLAAAFAAIAAVLAETAAAEQGLGVLITQAGASQDTALSFAAVVVLVAFSLLLFALLTLTGRRTAPWSHA